MSHVVGIDLSSHAVDLVKLDENSNRAIWERRILRGATAFDRCRQVRAAMPTGSWWDDVYLVAAERPFGAARNAQAALYRTLGAVIACVPSGLPLWEVPPHEWRAGLGLGARASKVECAARVLRLSPRISREQWPQDAFDAFAVAYVAREKNRAAIEAAA